MTGRATGVAGMLADASKPALTTEQRRAIDEIVGALEELEFDTAAITARYDDLVARLASVTDTGRELLAMLRFLAVLVYCERLASYWLARLLLQRVAGVNLAGVYAAVARLVAQAQTHAFDDGAMLTLEHAHFIAHGLDHSGEETGELARLRNDLAMHHRWYTQWCRRFDYLEANPSAESPGFLYLEAAVSAGLRADAPDTPLTEANLQTVIDRCSTPELAYLRVLARKYLAMVYAERRDVQRTLEAYRLASEDAVTSGLDAEIGHLHRMYAVVLAGAEHYGEAIAEATAAFSHDAHPTFSYWRASSARLLGGIYRAAAEEVAAARHDWRTPRAVELREQSARAFRDGREQFELHLGDYAGLPIARAVKLQMFRVYAENALTAARVDGPVEDLLSEIEVDSPREAADAILEVELMRSKDAAWRQNYRAARAVFQRHLSTRPEPFEAYVDALVDEYPERRKYLEMRRELASGVPFETSDVVVRRVLELDLNGAYLILFFVGATRTSVVLYDGERHDAALEHLDVSDRDIAVVHEECAAKVSEAAWMPDPGAGVRPALESLLDHYRRWFGPFFEAVLPLLRGRHVKLFPRMHMTAAPLHAIVVGAGRLIDHCDVSYAQSLTLFARGHAGASVPTSRLAAVIDERGAPAFEGTVRALAGVLPLELLVLRNPSWDDVREEVSDAGISDLFFGCHGAYDPLDPGRSVLRFGSPNGISFSQLVGELDLPRLRSVTMGACESGLGRAEIPSEYVGLPNVFLAAGVRYVIGSLWKVNQLATAVLLGRFFDLASATDISLPVALNRAQRETAAMTRDELAAWVGDHLPSLAERLGPSLTTLGPVPFADPYFWAGFYVAGDT